MDKTAQESENYALHMAIVLSNVTDMLLGEESVNRSYEALLIALEKMLAVVNAARMDPSPTAHLQKALAELNSAIAEHIEGGF